ncbi:Plastid lipid-associated protein/fibrillin conserved domain [Arabidopsis thaliana x Arabidopsis arenosa]|uniref:Plastid lipid-associated protein/fibrillin conserved domain n=3 Tax=Arabidopsis TaxID=3701 RepID=A0A8T2AK12_ARASU|nr:Plastid lipid-associated protein/fibrillin conserved domain [Arabidopsis thaliana x Arabidopsis arenosa]KAG7574582.1 Plastid lipid-associated protein/fibrillin conserved domain [Arabidopsis suecica]
MSLSPSSSSMALLHGSISGTSAVRLGFSTSASPSRVSLVVPVVKGWKNSCRRRVLRAMVQETVLGSPSVYAREMERLSAKESLVLALKDAGGFEALVTGKTTNMQRIDVNERITSLERLNPTPRPTTSPCFEGRWNFEWFGSGSPGLLAARVIFERFPSTLANLSRMEILIKDANAKATANIKLLNSIESKIILSSKLTVEGPLRLKEEYVEGMLESPTVIEEAVPEQLKGALGQAATTLQQLPALIKDTLASGLRIPLSGSFERFFMISYLDEEILIVRDTEGVPEVLTRIETPSSTVVETLEYDS